MQLPSKVVEDFDPLANLGKAGDLTGMLKNSSGQNPVLDGAGHTIDCDATSPCATGTCVEGQCRKNPFNFWTIVVRERADISIP